MLTVTFTQEELNALGSLLDVAVKASGIQGARAALPIIDKLERAVAQANAPKPDAPKSNVTPDFKGVPLNATQENE